jgi:hypothetical protein
MPLVCKLFTQPAPDPRLEACLVSDSAHIGQGAFGDHVAKIQMALNSLSRRPGRQDFNLKIDGIFGPKTAAAVQAYKNGKSRPILQPWQKTADAFVGKRTIKSLDDEMDILENELPVASRYVATSHLGADHDHSKCGRAPGEGENGPDGKVSHIGTPINPQGTGIMINIGGLTETNYLGFQDCFPDPNQDSQVKPDMVGGRRLTSTLEKQSVSDICFRSTPIDRYMRIELERIAKLGCRLTYCSHQHQVLSVMPYLCKLGPIIEHIVLPRAQASGPEDNSETQERHAVVVTMLMHIR